MTKSVLSEQREADEGLCKDLWWHAAISDNEETHDLCRMARTRIRALSEALREACHERDGLLAKVEMMGWNPSETAPSGPRVLARGRWRPLPAPPGED